VIVFAYDTAGSLSTVSRNGVVVEGYEYDGAGNGTRVNSPAGITSGTYASPFDRMRSRIQDDADEALRALHLLISTRAVEWHPSSDARRLAERLLALYASGSSADRQHLRESTDVAVHGFLLSFSQHMAMLAVRDRSVERLRCGLLAIALAGSSPADDWRDTSMRMLPLRDAASRLGPETLPAFDEAASLTTEPTAGELRSWAARPSFTLWGRIQSRVSRIFAQEFWRPKGTGDEFRYGSGGVSHQEAQRMIERYNGLIEARKGRNVGR
jgi:YD repeat-containing protein